jgi:hypothetical protein
VNIDREQATRTEQIDMKGKKGIIVYFTRVGNTDFAKDVDAVSSASLMNDGGKLAGNILTENKLEGKTLYSLVTHGGSGFGNAIKDTPKWTSAKVSPLTLSVYDDEVKTALPKVIEWVKKIASSPDGAM